MARSTVEFGLRAINAGDRKARDLIPRLLEVLSRYMASVGEQFEEGVADTPAWMFLRWINQLVALLNRPEHEHVESKVLEIATEYPQALFYPFRVVESNAALERNGFTGSSPLFTKLQRYFARFENLNRWVDSLDCLVYPEHRLKYWLEALQEAFPSDAEKNSAQLDRIAGMMLADVAAPERPGLGTKIGAYNSKFVNGWTRGLRKFVGEEGTALGSKKHRNFIDDVALLHEKLQEYLRGLGTGERRLADYSDWLAEYDCSNFYDPREYLEVPGQYEGLAEEPLRERHVKIASVSARLLVLASIRRPKRITVHGSNEKEYHLLVKGGEDLRLD